MSSDVSYRFDCTCGAMQSGFGRALTVKHANEHKRLHQSPEWLAFFGNKMFNVTVKKDGK